jgi:hypothetical protein
MREITDLNFILWNPSVGYSIWLEVPTLINNSFQADDASSHVLMDLEERALQNTGSARLVFNDCCVLITCVVFESSSLSQDSKDVSKDVGLQWLLLIESANHKGLFLRSNVKDIFKVSEVFIGPELSSSLKNVRSHDVESIVVNRCELSELVLLNAEVILLFILIFLLWGFVNAKDEGGSSPERDDEVFIEHGITSVYLSCKSLHLGFI